MVRRLDFIMTGVLVLLTASCTGVKFNSPSDAANTGKGCAGQSCANSEVYSWYEGGFGICSKPCGGGSQSEIVECHRVSDNVTVPDSNCTLTKPPGVRICNMQMCTSTYTWNWGNYGTCSKTCDSGVETRAVVCQDQNGNAVADSNCAPPKPATTISCNTDPCTGGTSYTWSVTAGLCSVQCGGGTATDTVVCKKSDGTVAADSFCSQTTKPPTTRTCNTNPCTTTYTYAWEAGAYGACSVTCGDGVQVRSVACKRSDGTYVNEIYCDAASKPATTGTCHPMDCPGGGHQVTQTATVTPASNTVDVVLIVDDSSSMANDQAKLASRLIQFVNDLDTLNIDYQICLTTTDIGYYKGAPIKWQGTNSVVLNKNTPNKNTVFQNTVAALGAQWSSDEQGIKATYEMIRDFGPNSGTANSGCFRAKSTLTVIEISDEDERSVGGNQSLSTAQYQPLTFENYPDNLVTLVHQTFDTAGFVKPFFWNSIIVKPGDTACEAQEDAEGSPSFPGVLLAQLSTKTGGQIASICDADYANNMTLIKDKLVNSMPGLDLQCTPLDNPAVSFQPPFATTATLTGATLKFTPALPENEQVTATYTCP